jgi:putative ATPase
VETLFDEHQAGAAEAGAAAPLASRARPRALAGFVGQQHILREGSSLRTALERGEPHSMILYGPPGSGKTSLARMFAESPGWVFEEHSAVQVGLAEVRAVRDRARTRRTGQELRTVFFLDEIHRFNRSQQDALLPVVEEGLITLIGATTENPAFEVNGALLSRLRVYALDQLSPEDVQEVLRRAIASGQAGKTPVADDAIGLLAARVEGDARVALNALELAEATARELEETEVSAARAADALQQRAVLYDRAGDRHYDYISAWIKATRGSDPDASLYYLAVMLEGGEDPRFIVRRMVILASEDIGNADPGALQVAVAAAAAVEHVGMPEARYALAQAAIYLSLAPKSNAAGRALGAAQQLVREQGARPVPAWLISGPRPGRRRGRDRDEAGTRTGGGARGELSDYDSPHSHPGHISPQELLPDGVADERFYAPDEAEAELAARLERIRRLRGRA